MSTENRKYLIKLNFERNNLSDAFPRTPGECNEINMRYISSGKLNAVPSVSPDGLKVIIDMYFDSNDSYLEWMREIEKTPFWQKNSRTLWEENFDGNTEIVGYTNFIEETS